MKPSDEMLNDFFQYSVSLPMHGKSLIIYRLFGLWKLESRRSFLEGIGRTLRAPIPLAGSADAQKDEIYEESRAAIDARTLLQREIEHVASIPT